MVIYMILGVVCVIYDGLYFVHNIKKNNVIAAVGAAVLAVLSIAVGTLFLIAHL